MKAYLGCLGSLFLYPVCMSIAVGVIEGEVVPSINEEMERYQNEVLRLAERIDVSASGSRELSDYCMEEIVKVSSF